MLELHAVLAQVYRQGRYSLVLNYSAEPPVSLRKKGRKWVEEMLKEKGLR